MKTKDYIFPLILVVFGASIFSYIFKSNIDLNGDNCTYYIITSSLAQGNGFSNVMGSPTDVFPPGYPLLMTPLRLITDSVIAQKILNGVFLIAAVVMLYFILVQAKFSKSLSFVCCCAALLIPRVFHFATIMMSEMSFLLFSVIVLFALTKLNGSKSFYKDPWFYVMVLCLVFAYHIRTQGISLVGAIILSLFLAKKWKAALGTIGIFAVGCLPWILRNKVLDLGGSRYFAQIVGANSWHPEQGTLGLGEIITRFFETIQMLITKALPSSIIPFFNVDYKEPTTFLSWIIGATMLAIIVFGFWRITKLRWSLILYIVFTFGIIALFNAPSEDRYLISIMPLLTIGLFTGIWAIISWFVKLLSSNLNFSPWFLVLLFLFSISGLKQLHKINRTSFPPNYQNFFTIGNVLKQNVSPETIVCSRKPDLLYMYSGTKGVGYPYTANDSLLISSLINNNVQYVVLEQLGYSSTPQYLYPAIQKNEELFSITSHVKNPDTYLLYFHRDKAMKKFNH